VMTTPFDFSAISALLQRTQEINRCSTCQQFYHKTWCPMDRAACLFCKTYAPHPYVYATLLRDAEWYFLKSGESHPQDFYPRYLDAIHLWCQVYDIRPTRDDQMRREELLSLLS